MRRSATALVASALIVGSIAGYEGYSAVTYRDAVGVPTWGFGTIGGVQMGQKTDPVRAVQRLAADVTDTAREASACIGDVPLAQHEFDAFVSMAYNVGTPAFCRSTLVKKLHATPPDYAGACREILRWDYAGGERLPGLTRRRADEYRRCMGTAQ